MAIDHHPGFGYRLEAPGFGRYRVSSDGLRVSCAPRRLAAWRRDRFLTARVLPLAALLRGLELLHASAVAFNGSTVAIAGPSHSGKTSLAIRLVLEGARFVTDDVLALEAFDGEVIAHPGAAVAGVRHAEHVLLTADDQSRLGRSSDRGDKVWASLSREERPLPLRLIYLISRGSKADSTAIDEVPRLDPRMLLGNAFLNGVVRTPERLKRQLESCAQLSRAVAMFRLRIPPEIGASAVAREVAMHAGAVLDRRSASTAAPGRHAAGAAVARTKANIKA